MKPIILTSFLLLLLFNACSQGQAQQELDPQAFQAAYLKDTQAVLLDVRTPGEFQGGYIPRALNIDWNGSDFDQRIKNLDKNQSVYVYCLSGGRSADAADFLRKEGFRQVYELKGGINAWRNAGLPESSQAPASHPTGMDKARFDELIKQEKPVLVNFFATWCTPCKQMEPYIQTLEQDTQGKVTVLRLDADENKNLLKDLHIAAIPTLQLYKQGELVWSHEGLISREELLQRMQ